MTKAEQPVQAIAPVGGTLMDRVRQAHVVEEWLVESGGEITPEIAQLLEEVEKGLAEKVDGYHHLIGYAEAQAKLWSEKAERLQKIANGCNSFAQMLERRLKEAMILAGVTELTGEEVRYKLQRTAPQLLLREQELPVEYLVVKQTTAPDKVRIRQELTNGATIKGAALVEQVCLRSYAAKGVRK